MSDSTSPPSMPPLPPPSPAPFQNPYPITRRDYGRYPGALATEWSPVGKGLEQVRNALIFFLCMWIPLIGLILGLVGTVLLLVGLHRCAKVPVRSAKRLAHATRVSACVMLGAMIAVFPMAFALFASFGASGGYEWMGVAFAVVGLAIIIAPLVGWITFTFFLREAGKALGDRRLASHTMWYFGGILVIAALAIALAGTAEGAGASGGYAGVERLYTVAMGASALTGIGGLIGMLVLVGRLRRVIGSRPQGFARAVMAPVTGNVTDYSTPSQPWGQPADGSRYLDPVSPSSSPPAPAHSETGWQTSTFPDSPPDSPWNPDGQEPLPPLNPPSEGFRDRTTE